ncbi:iron-compound ABC transporter permease [Streptococcus pneumoniae]|nr:iron-compound ABC transporter permease [Streptococcus pneumoniae]
MRNKKQINLGIIFVICLGLLITIFLSLKLGTKEINIRDFLAAFGMGNTNDDFIKSIIYKRIPRTIFAILAGSSLAISGVLMQSVTRNPIADPGILGINTGASLSVVIGLSFLGISSSHKPYKFCNHWWLSKCNFCIRDCCKRKSRPYPYKTCLIRNLC